MKITVTLGYWANSPKGAVYVVQQICGAITIQVTNPVTRDVRIDDDLSEREAENLSKGYSVKVVPYSRE